MYCLRFAVCYVYIYMLCEGKTPFWLRVRPICRLTIHPARCVDGSLADGSFVEYLQIPCKYINPLWNIPQMPLSHTPTTRHILFGNPSNGS